MVSAVAKRIFKSFWLVPLSQPLPPPPHTHTHTHTHTPSHVFLVEGPFGLVREDSIIGFIRKSVPRTYGDVEVSLFDVSLEIGIMIFSR